MILTKPSPALIPQSSLKNSKNKTSLNQSSFFFFFFFFNNFHIFAADLQIYLSCRPREIESVITKVNIDIISVYRWAENSNLKINIGTDKRTLFGSRVYLNNLYSLPSLFFYCNPLKFFHNVKNLRLIFD